MRVGFVYDAKEDYRKFGLTEESIAEFDSEETLSAIAATLTELGFEIERIGNIQHLVTRLAAGDHAWDLVFNLAEGLHGMAREATVPALLDAYQIPYVFSGPTTMAITLDKSIAKRLVAAADLPTAEFAVIYSEQDISKVVLPYPVFAKPLAEGSGKGVLATSRAADFLELLTISQDLLERFAQPILVETYLPGREFTVGIIGSGEDARVIGVAEIGLQTGADGHFNSYHNKQNELETYQIVRDPEALKAAEVALAAWQVLGGKDAGRVDLRSDDKKNPHFLELNPLAGLQEGYSELPILAELNGMPYKALLESIMRAALVRLGLPWPEVKLRA